MTASKTLISVWQQVLVAEKLKVKIEGAEYTVTTLRAKKLKMVEFEFGDFSIAGIEQNPKTTSRWAELARDGNRIMQFRCNGRYIANVCEGKLLRYPAWRALALPE
ncbi:MAG TPA: hypothetical protein VKV95_07155 [Terriglobia bacterium]|nr:hypothetical protein [Terriglobia bacterium]